MFSRYGILPGGEPASGVIANCEVISSPCFPGLPILSALQQSVRNAESSARNCKKYIGSMNVYRLSTNSQQRGPSIQVNYESLSAGCLAG